MLRGFAPILAAFFHGVKSKRKFNCGKIFVDSLLALAYTRQMETKGNLMIKRISAMPKPELCGWLGMILVQSATVPVSVGNILGWTNALPPLSMILLVWAGLALYFVRAFYQRDTLYMVSNGLGFFLNSVVLALIAYPWI